jgi:hypothetical protein
MLVNNYTTWVLVAAFTLSRTVLYTTFPFRIDYLPWLNQLLDVEILKYNLLEGLYYLHSTPPLYNAFVGVMLKAYPSEAMLAFAFQGLYALFALATALMSAHIARFLGASERWALVAGLLVIANPILFRFEIVPFYALPLAFLVTFSVYALTRALLNASFWYGAVFLALIATTVLFRNFFHVIVFMLPIAGLAAYILRTKARAGMIPIALVITLCVGAALTPSIANYVRYGMFTSSTWQGMQLYSATFHVPREKIETLIKVGEVSSLSLLPRFENPDIYYAYYREPVRDSIPALHALYKTGTEYGNFNNEIYVRTAEEYGHNARVILSHYPWYFVPKFINSAYIFFGTANYRYFYALDDWLIFSPPWYFTLYQGAKYFAVPLVIAAAFFSGILYLLAWLWSTRGRWGNPELVALTIAFILLYVFVVANVVELGENFTARVPIDPLITILVVVVCYQLYLRIQKIG